MFANITHAHLEFIGSRLSFVHPTVNNWTPTCSFSPYNSSVPFNWNHCLSHLYDIPSSPLVLFWSQPLTSVTGSSATVLLLDPSVECVLDSTTISVPSFFWSFKVWVAPFSFLLASMLSSDASPSSWPYVCVAVRPEIFPYGKMEHIKFQFIITKHLKVRTFSWGACLKFTSHIKCDFISSPHALKTYKTKNMNSNAYFSMLGLDFVVFQRKYTWCKLK